MTTLVFAYGSNLAEAQIAERCPGAVALGRAVLANHALVFAGSSARWQGGAVASVVRQRGGRVDGVVYALADDDLKSLDRHEGHPFAYVRERRFVTVEAAGRKRVDVYVQPADGLDVWAPGQEYLLTTALAYSRWGFDSTPLHVAAGLVRAAGPARLFVYGSLLSAEVNHHVLGGARFVRQAKTAPGYSLFSLGAFPGMVAMGSGTVRGEVYEVSVEGVLRLDRFEGHPAFYRRVPVRLEGGEVAQAYVLLPAQVEGKPVVESGCWATQQKVLGA